MIFQNTLKYKTIKIPLIMDTTMKYRSKAISWMLHSIKILLGDESIRRYIILFYNGHMKNRSEKDIRTFDAFVADGKKELKIQEIITYCESICKRKGVFVFTATNIQRNKFDNETHYQSFIVNNTVKKLIVIDPAYNRNKAGIYVAEVATEVIMPFFKDKSYKTHFVDLTTPAQICEGDVFCQSWSLYLLLHKLQNNEYIESLEFEIPESQLDKYDMLLDFYKQIFTDICELHDNLRVEFVGEITNARGPNAPKKIDKEAIAGFDPVALLLDMTKYDMA